MKDFWNPQRVEDRAKSMRSEAEADKRIADIRIQFAVTLEDIANAWAKDHKTGDATEPRTAHWIRWGQYLKCSACGHMVEEKADECPECKAKMEVKE